MRNLLLLLLILSTFLFSCKKDKGSETTPATDTTSKTSTTTGTGTTPGNDTTATTGSITGTISPAGAATGITAMVGVNGQIVTYNAMPDNNGSFKFTDLPQGSYLVSFTPGSGYAATNKTVVVMAGKNTDLGSVVIPLTPGSISGTVSPVGGASQIIITNDNTHVTFYVTPDANTGIFKSNILLPVGTYTISSTAALGYTAPASKSITVTTGQNTDAGTIVFTPVAKGSISGTISPAGSVANVLATYIGSVSLQYKVIPDANGNFQILNVTPGTYSIAVVPVTGNGFYAPYNKMVAVSGGQDTKLGQIILTQTPPPYPASATIDGTASSASYLLQAAYISSKLSMTASLGGYTLYMTINGVTGPGEYSCNSTSSSTVTLSKVTSTTYLQGDWVTRIITQGWSSTLSDAIVIVKITSIDPVTQTVTGTFSGTLNATPNTTGTKTITSGTFVIPYTL